MIQYWMRWLWWETQTYLFIALDLVLGFFTAYMAVGLVPGDWLNLPVFGSVVFVAVCTVPWWLLDQYVQRRIASGH
jgi:Flp pilus assembly protein TadB